MILNDFSFLNDNDDWLRTWYWDFFDFVIFKNIFLSSREDLCLTSKIIVIRVWINLKKFMISCRIRFLCFKKFFASRFDSATINFSSDNFDNTSYNISNEEMFENAFADVFNDNSTFENKLFQHFSYCFINRQRRTFFAIWFDLFACSSTNEWYVVIKLSFTSHLTNNFLQNSDVNFEFLSNTIRWKTSQDLYTNFQYRSIYAAVEKFSIFDINLTYFEKRFMIVKNALFFLIIMNNFTMKFKLISKRNFWKIEINWSFSYDFWVESLKIWQNEHAVTYFLTRFLILDMKADFRKKS
jgi:hypothetical protein